MAATYTAALRNARQDAITTAIGNGGKLVIKTSSGGTTLVTFTAPTANAMFGASSGGVITMNTFIGTGGSTNTVNAAATGTAAYAEIQTSAAAAVVTNLTVGTSASDVIITNTAINTSDPITITFGSCTMTSGNT